MTINNVPNKMLLESEKLEQSAKIRLVEVDLTSLGGTIYRFHGGMNEKFETVKWQGFDYEPFPTKIDGVQRKAKGASNRPTLALSNVTGIVTGMFQQYQELVGARIVVRDVYAKFLDPENFASGENPNYDPMQEYVSLYEIQKPASIDRQFASFELSMPIEADKAVIPPNIITTNTCQWIYRGEGCRYSGNKYFNRKDEPVTSMGEDVCGKRENSCKIRFGDDVSIPIRIFPSCDKVGK